MNQNFVLTVLDAENGSGTQRFAQGDMRKSVGGGRPDVGK